MKTIERGYSFNDVTIVPTNKTHHPSLSRVFVANRDAGKPDVLSALDIPFIASAMDSVSDAHMASRLRYNGGLGVINLEGIESRHDDPKQVYAEIEQAPPEKSSEVLQSAYLPDVRPDLINRTLMRHRAAMNKNSYTGLHQHRIVAVAASPSKVAQYMDIIKQADPDIFFLQSTVTTVRHQQKLGSLALSIDGLIEYLDCPVIVGNVVTYEAAWDLMQAGAAGILVGVGPGAACTSRAVLGIGVPQVTAIIDCAEARDTFFAKTGTYVRIIADGGMRNGGDICKAIVAGADMVMLGSPFARTLDSPLPGLHWGMAAFDAQLPRGTLVDLGEPNYA